MISRAIACFLLALCVALPTAAQEALLQVTGAVQKPLSLSRADLQALQRRDYSEQRSITQDGKQVQLAIRYQGVPLKELLDRAVLTPDRHAIRKAVVLLTARDGYQASFSWGELYNSGLGDGVVVVLRQGESELLDSEGLPSLRSLQDLRPGPRHVRWLTRIEVLLPDSR
ncbi:molybdopterin-dependent oxidoreductase [uncultured Ramlibacter sp.]|uniref:molybdopterin-dependent oxidoreductase n=1 Tax=uncultured Ramlibacter sp. TaxID=260755 RepID=UPI00260AF83C|nr:molybdopterin-dependent oxidoreductase [uncultured Ramlibacter sp.]